MLIKMQNKKKGRPEVNPAGVTWNSKWILERDRYFLFLSFFCVQHLLDLWYTLYVLKGDILWQQKDKNKKFTQMS